MDTALEIAVSREALRLRLLGLRAEIDAILVDLAPGAAPIGQEASTVTADALAQEPSAAVESARRPLTSRQLARKVRLGLSPGRLAPCPPQTRAGCGAQSRAPEPWRPSKPL